jgi:hypothetical protein
MDILMTITGKTVAYAKKMNKIEIKPKSPKDKTNTNTYPDQLSATKRGKREKAVVS